EGLRWLARATSRRPTTAAAAAYVLQAAVAAEHARAPRWADTDWAAIVAHYDRLAALTRSPVVELNRAVAVSFADGPAAALPLLDRLADDPRLARSHRLHAARADVRRRLRRTAEAAGLYRPALAPAPTAPEPEHPRRGRAGRGRLSGRATRCGPAPRAAATCRRPPARRRPRGTRRGCARRWPGTPVARGGRSPGGGWPPPCAPPCATPGPNRGRPAGCRSNRRRPAAPGPAGSAGRRGGRSGCRPGRRCSRRRSGRR